MADHFEFRSNATEPEETYYKYELKGVMISSYNTGGSEDSKPVPELQYDDTTPDFIDDFLF